MAFYDQFDGRTRPPDSDREAVCGTQQHARRCALRRSDGMGRGDSGGRPEIDDQRVQLGACRRFLLTGWWDGQRGGQGYGHRHSQILQDYRG